MFASATWARILPFLLMTPLSALACAETAMPPTPRSANGSPTAPATASATASQSSVQSTDAQSAASGPEAAVAVDGEFAEDDCASPSNATATWYADRPLFRRCEVTCNTGYADCDGSRSNGCETDVSDPAACGQCVDACLSELCGTEPVCASHTAEVWVQKVSGSPVRGIAVAPNGDLLLRVNGLGAATSEHLPAVGPGALMRLSPDGPLWQTLPGDASIDSAESDVYTRMVTTSAGLYIADCYFSAEVAGYHAEAKVRDVMLSRVDLDGNLIWTRPLNIPDNVNVWGLFADEEANAYLQIYTDGGYEFDGFSSDGGSVVFSFAPDGAVRWVDEVSPYSVAPASRGYFATSELLFSDTLISAASGEYVGDIPAANGGSILSIADEGTFTVAGTATGSDMQRHAGLPGHRSVTIDGQATTERDAIFVQRFDTTGSLLWETHFAAKYNNRLYDIEVTSDGTVYLLASGDLFDITSFDTRMARVFVARIGPDGQQRGAYSFKVGKPVAATFALAPDGTFKLGAAYSDDAVFDVEKPGSGIAGVSLRFEP